MTQRAFRVGDLVRVTKGARRGRTGRVEGAGAATLRVRFGGHFGPLLTVRSSSAEAVSGTVPPEARPRSVGALYHPARGAR